ncbi:DUF6216 family protein [Aeromonas enteropelogenes]|uniref:DUF6216 family protein n=1 Tax=Aeromonas enteropelogenes TaxID=29489 RepID=UPI003989F872
MSSIVNIESFVSIVTVLIFLGCICFYIHRRSGSSFSLINKIVNFLYSGKKFHSEEIEIICKEREDVERFNAIFSTRAENKKQIIELYAWVNKFGLNFKMLTNLGGNLDMKRRKITKIGWFEIAFSGLLTPVMAILSLFILAISINNSALIKLNDDKDVGWFWINDKVAYSFQAPYESDSTKWKVYKKSCEKGVKNKSIPESFNNMLCESFDSEESLLYINDLIESQKMLKYHAFLIMFFALYMYSLTNQSLRAKKARKMVYARTVTYIKAKRKN